MLAEADDGLTDAGEAEFVGVDFADRNPECFGSIVGSMDGGFQGVGVAMDADEVVHVKGVDAHAAVLIDVGRGEEITDVLYVESGFFFDLATHPLLACLVHIDKAAGKVERSLGGFLGPPHDKQLVVVVDDKGCGCGAGVGVVGETARLTAFALEVVDNEVATATDGAKSEFLKRVFH